MPMIQKTYTIQILTEHLNCNVSITIHKQVWKSFKQQLSQ